MDPIEIMSMVERNELEASGFSQLEDRKLSFIELCQKNRKKVVNYMKGYLVLIERKFKGIRINYKLD